MAADPKKTLPSSSFPATVETDIEKMLESGMADFSIRELLGFLLSSVGAAERSAYLELCASSSAKWVSEKLSKSSSRLW